MVAGRSEVGKSSLLRVRASRAGGVCDGDALPAADLLEYDPR